MKQLIRGVMTGVGLGAVILTVGVAAQAPVKVEMKNGQGQSIGTASLTQSMGMVLIQLDLKGLPAGQHALHVHQTAKCEGPAFTSAAVASHSVQPGGGPFSRNGAVSSSNSASVFSMVKRCCTTFGIRSAFVYQLATLRNCEHPASSCPRQSISRTRCVRMNASRSW